MRHESLDDQIDRVAAAMTDIGADGRLAARLRTPINQPRTAFHWPTLVVASAVVAFAIVAVTVQRQQSEWVEQDVRSLAARAVMPFTPLRATEPSVSPTVDVRTAGVAVTVEMPGDGAIVVSPPSMETSESTAPLIVAELTVMPLPDPDVASIPPLEISPIDIPDITGVFKESFK